MHGRHEELVHITEAAWASVLVSWIDDAFERTIKKKTQLALTIVVIFN